MRPPGCGARGDRAGVFVPRRNDFACEFRRRAATERGSRCGSRLFLSLRICAATPLISARKKMFKTSKRTRERRTHNSDPPGRRHPHGCWYQYCCCPDGPKRGRCQRLRWVPLKRHSFRRGFPRGHSWHCCHSSRHSYASFRGTGTTLSYTYPKYVLHY